MREARRHCMRKVYVHIAAHAVSNYCRADPQNRRRESVYALTSPRRYGERPVDHRYGTLGVSLHDALIARAWLAPDKAPSNEYSLTAAGERHLTSLGIDLDELRTAKRRFAFACLDWSERRPHLGGALAAALLSMMIANRWVKRGTVTTRSENACAIATT